VLFSWQQFVHFSPGGGQADRLTGRQADRLTGGQADKTSLRAAEGKKFPAVSRPCMNVHFFPLLRLYSKSNAYIVQGSLDKKESSMKFSFLNKWRTR
jgi:hypothetical protein